MLKFTVNAKDVEKMLRKAADKTSSGLRNPLRDAGLYMVRETISNFTGEHDPDGRPWAPLAASTLARKKTSTKLRETGAMAAANRLYVGGKTARIKNSIDYAIWHQTGTKRMPQRQFLGISESRHVPNIQKIFQSWIDDL